jgi:hypothetical protein
MRRLLAAALLLGLLATAAPARAADPVAAFDGQGMWIWQVAATEGGDVARIAARARDAGLSFVVVKAAHGAQRWPQFSAELVDALHAAGLRVCAYQRALARRPASEARVLAGAVASGADCLVIDAEIEYEGRYAQAAAYVRALRAAVGPEVPVGFTGFPFVDLHPRFPYSVFLGPGGADVNLPQVYWRMIGVSVTGAMSRTWAQNAIYGRPLRPIGQLFGGTSGADALRFRALAAAGGASGVSWWVWQHATPAHWRALRGVPVTTLSLPGRPVPALGRGSAGDQVRWLQLRLRAWGEQVAVTSRFDAATAGALRRFKLARLLPPSPAVDADTWRALLGAPAP